MKRLVTLLLMTVFALSLAIPVQAASKIYATEDCNLRKGPGLDFEPYTSVKKGTTLNYLKKTSTDERGVKWYKITYKKKTLWVSSRCASKTKAIDTKSKNVVVTTADVNLRKGPGTKYKRVATVSQDSSFKYLGQTKKDNRGVKWYKIAYKGKGVWVSSKYSVRRNNNSNKKVVTTAGVHLRKGPGTQYEVYAAVVAGTSLQYLGKTGNWFKVYYEDRTLYVSATYAKLVNK